MKRAMVVGALGQVGRELVVALNEKLGSENVFPTDIKIEQQPFEQALHQLDVLDLDHMRKLCLEHEIDTMFNLAALLSATAEQKPVMGWRINMEGLMNSLNLAKEGVIKKLFWPSSIAIFGPSTPRINTPQHTVAEPTTVYGISKLAGERWCEYYAQKHNVDVRSIRYPGLIGYKSLPGGGTTDYAVDIFHQAKKAGHYTCFLSEHTALPMMYMEDAIKATLDIMLAPAEAVKVRSSYNVSGFSFTPAELAKLIQTHLPTFQIDYAPDFRQSIADSWPASIDDSAAQKDWGWKGSFSLEDMVADMLKNIN